jgi:DNA-binding SARP family transcriptional activator/tetratricopeptide (TPR) repeat protein
VVVEFGLLGPLLVRREGEEIPVPAARQRVLLAALLFRAGQVVAVDELAEALWDGEWPASARVTVRNYVKRLRQALGDLDHSRIVTRADGYLIGVAAGELDLFRFEELRGQAGQCARAGRWAEASVALQGALGLWRGEPLAGVPSDVLARRELPRLAELRLQVAEDRFEADLHLGQHGGLIGGLRQLAAAEPLRERLVELLMLALYRAGRQGDALAAYRRARAALVGELGVEPGPGLRELHRRILAGDPALAAPAAAAVSGPAPVPRQLPAGVGHFVGREREIGALSALAGDRPAAAGTVVISAVGGTAGVGKTALAVHWAHQVAGRFPDGQLYVNLRGFGPSGTPVTPEEAIRAFLAALGVAAERIPGGPQAQAGLYRSLLFGKRMLIVADNARDEAQVRPLLPASPGCLVLVTSRRRLDGLAAAEGAHALTLDVLTQAEAAALLERRLGAGRVAAEPGPAAEIIGLCARLPLALAVTAARAAAHPGFPLAALAAGLRGEQDRLTALDAGDPATSVRAAFSWSYRQLTDPAARMFRLISLHPGPDTTTDAAASLAAVAARRARNLLDELAGAHLLAEHASGRFAFHDLLRAYAAELAHAQDSDQERRGALTGLFDYYLAAVAAAMDAVFPAEKHRRPQPPAPARPVAPLPARSPAAARDWLDAERASLVAVTTHAAAGGWPGHAIALAAIMHRYLQVGGHFPDAQAVFASALQAARQMGDLAAQADSLRNLGLVDAWQSHYQQAAGKLRSALELYHQLGDRRGQAQTLSDLGIIDRRQGRFQQAVGHHRQALDLFRDIGDRFGESRALGNLGIVEMRQGHYEQAASHDRESLAIYRELGDRRGEAIALDNLGEVLSCQGRYQQAEDHLGRALAIYRELGHRHGEADALQNLARIRREQARHQQAAGLYRQALTIFREIGDRSSEAEALNGLGETLSQAGLPGQARAHHHDALTLASQTGSRYEQARAHDGLARGYHATGDHGQARHHWQHALAAYTDMGVPEAGQVRARLDDLGLLQAERNPASRA